jgi:hypothetical protein
MWSALSALGSITPPSLSDLIAARSAACQRVPAALMRTMAWSGRAEAASVARAASLSSTATASSRSTITASAPEAAALA